MPAWCGIREEQVRGGTQRTYTAVESAVSLGPDAFGSASPADQRYFAAFAGALVANFNHYLRTADASPTRDAVAYQQIPVWVTPAESRELATRITELLAPCEPRRTTPPAAEPVSRWSCTPTPRRSDHRGVRGEV